MQFIETQFPIARLSAESYKERKAGASQTLTGLGKWWGRKPLILVRAAIIGMLMPASNDPKRDREIFLKILAMDDDGVWQRCLGDIPVIEWRNAASKEIQELYFAARGFRQGLSDEEKEHVCAQIWNSLSSSQQKSLDATRRRPVPDRLVFDAMPYAQRIKHCLRPEQTTGPTARTWQEINDHLATTASNLPGLVEQLGQRLFGHAPRVGDAFCGGGSIPFEAARIGAQAFGSDLNPVACLLTWTSLNLLGGGPKLHEDVRRMQEEVLAAVDHQIVEWGIESNEKGERSDAYLYCMEVRPEGCEYFIPLAPSWVVSEKYRIVVVWKRKDESDRLHPDVISVSAAELEQYKAKKGATIIESRVVDPLDSNRTWSFEALRGPAGLRRWANEDLVPRPGDVFQERLYCIRWIDGDGNRRYAAPDAQDLARESRVLELVRERFVEWQNEGCIPSRAIPEDGVETARLSRERGWTFWHHLFTPRQLLMHGTFMEIAMRRADASKPFIAACLVGIAASSDWSSKLCRWTPQLARSGGIGASVQTFYNMALNTLFTWANRPFKGFAAVVRFAEAAHSRIESSSSVYPADARDLRENCDLWITDPPYADAVNYHELGDFFLAWYEKQLDKAFPDWVPDARAELAVRGDGDDFRRSMVEIYRNLAQHMPDNGLQLVMFTHQNPAVWADLGMILWAAGLKATAAWTISTETEAAGIKKGNYVQGTVCLVLRKRFQNESGFLDEIYPMVEDEVRRQIDSMQVLDQGGEPNFNDADYQLAAYAAALKVLTQYSNIDGRDVEHEVFAVRSRNEKSDFQVVIERALRIACDYLVPRGLEHSWRDLSLTERYYLRSLDIESRGEHRKGMYEELARGFGVSDIRPLLKSDKANGARMMTPSGFESTLLAAIEGSEALSGALPALRGRSASRTPHPFSSSPLRHLLFAIRETATESNNPEPGRQYLRDTFGQGYWNQRERFINLLEWLSQLGSTVGMEEWRDDSVAARILAGRLRNDQA